jgi:hypothetical protein
VGDGGFNRRSARRQSTGTILPTVFGVGVDLLCDRFIVLARRPSIIRARRAKPCAVRRRIFKSSSADCSAGVNSMITARLLIAPPIGKP